LEIYFEPEEKTEKIDKNAQNTNLFGEDSEDEFDDWGDDDDGDNNDWDCNDDFSEKSEDQIQTNKDNPEITDSNPNNYKINPSFFPENDEISTQKIQVHKNFRPHYIYVESETDVYQQSALDDDDDEDGSLCGSFPQASSSSKNSHFQDSGDANLETITINLKEGMTFDEDNNNLTNLETKNYEKMTKSGNDDEYEKLNPSHGDVQLFKFIDYVKQNPLQILRYSTTRNNLHLVAFNDQARKNLKLFSVGNTCKCLYCGANCKFEIQLLPRIHDELVEDDSSESSSDKIQRTFLDRKLPDFDTV